jgi:tRNA(Ile)-lysidine synthase
MEIVDSVTGAAPLDAADFAALMAPLGPFESGPVFAVGVSGGADSLALCLLAQQWARSVGGAVVALSVDHGLRTESAAEAQQVAAWLAPHGISHHILRWCGEKPSSGIQAAAREARYALMRGWCAANGVLYLLLAHHQDDQAETFLLRLARGSGVDGLAAMAAQAAHVEVTLLRPLLDVPHARLVATLRARGQSWIEDPSNASLAYQRVRLRQMMPVLAREGLGGACLTATARRLRRARQALDCATNDLMVRAVSLDHRGFAWLTMADVTRAPDDIALRLIGRLCRTLGGTLYPPRLDRLERLFAELLAGLGGRRTFCGCLFVPKKQGLLVCREAARIGPSVLVRAGDSVLWDGRFTLGLSGQGAGRIEGLGHRGWLCIRDAVGTTILPREVLPTLPALVDHHGISAVPHLGYRRKAESDLGIERVHFTPANPLTLV